MSNPVGELISRVLPYGLTDAETDQIIAAVNAPKRDQSEERDTLLELRSLDALLGRSIAGGNNWGTAVGAQRIGVCLRRYELSPALKCR